VLVRTGGLEGGVRDGGAVGVGLGEAAVPAGDGAMVGAAAAVGVGLAAGDGAMVGAAAAVEFGPAPVLGAVAVGVPAW